MPSRSTSQGMEKALRQKLKDGRFTDVPETRSRVMASVKGKGNKSTERRLRLAFVRSRTKGWYVQPKNLIGNPDFFFPDSNVAVFVDGCFWHGCRRCGHLPMTNRAFWVTKISNTKKRDRRTTMLLRRESITVIRFWEHDVMRNLNYCIQKIQESLPS